MDPAQPVSQVVKVVKVATNATMPKRGSAGAAGFDIFASDSFAIQRGARRWVSSGVAFEIPVGMYGRICPRSGLSGAGIDIGAGIIDSDYRGLVRVLVINNREQSSEDATFEVKAGMRIAQIVFQWCYPDELVLVDETTLTERGASGFGSTGV